MSLEKAAHYRDLAENLRHEAEAVRDVDLKVQFLDIAMRYDKLAATLTRIAEKKPTN
jgi:hypothetical protein